jgi:hypothetical protein
MFIYGNVSVSYSRSSFYIIYQKITGLTRLPKIESIPALICQFIHNNEKTTNGKKELMKLPRTTDQYSCYELLSSVAMPRCTSPDPYNQRKVPEHPVNNLVNP